MYKRMQLLPLDVVPTAVRDDRTIPHPRSAFTQPLNRLDDSMKSILGDQSLSEYDKSRLYTQMLQRYLDIDKKYEDDALKVTFATPTATTTLPTPTPPLTQVVGAAAPAAAGVAPAPAPGPQGGVAGLGSAAAEAAGIEKDLNALPKLYRGRIKRMLESGDIDYDEFGQLVQDGKVIKGSNVVDLIHGAITKNKTVRRKAHDMPGWRYMKQYIPHKTFLRRSNVYKPSSARSTPSHGVWDVSQASGTLVDLPLIDFDYSSPEKKEEKDESLDWSNDYH